MNKHLSSSGTKLILLIALIFFFLSDVKQEPCKHWRLDRWEADENNPVLFWQKKICGIYCHISLISISRKKRTCSHIKCVQRYFRSEAGNLKVCYQIQVRLPCKRRSSCYGVDIYWATVRRNVTYYLKVVEFGCAGERAIWIAVSKFDEFCKRQFNKRRILFCTIL